MVTSLAERDKRVIWHPYTPQKYSPDPIPIISGSGAWLVDEKNNRYIDAISSWWVTVHGHGHPYIAEKIYEQAKVLEQVIFAGFTHEPAVRLAERLLEKLPGRFSKIFFSDNGSTATEVAVKMALQYWKNRGIKRKKVLALTNAYHGDTFGAMSFSQRGIFTDAFSDQLFDVYFANLPDDENRITLNDIVGIHSEDLLQQCACVIYEPLVQGAGGMLMHTAEKLDQFLKICRKNGVLCIADEVMTGFGRTGELFASNYCEEKPDIICLSKGLTGGSMAMGITACSQEIHNAFVDPDVLKTFFHGHSYTANPIACAAALASLDLFEDPQTLKNIGRISDANKIFAASLRDNAAELAIQHVRTTGTILAFDIAVQNAGYTHSIKEVVTKKALEQKVYLRPLGNTVYIMPPYCIKEDELKKVFEVVTTILNDIKKENGQ